MFRKPIKTDVLVVGGGTSGCVAAIQAGRLGMRTLLVEKNGMLGGTITVANVNFPGLFHAWGRQIISGIGFEAVERVAEAGGAELPDFSQPPKRHWHHQIRVNKFLFASVLDEMCLQAGVELRLHTMVAFAKEKEDCVLVGLCGKEGLVLCECKVVIDATGDANIADLLGYPLEKSDELQPGTLWAQLRGYDYEVINFVELKKKFEEALAEKRIRESDCENAENPFLSELCAGIVNMHVSSIDAVDSPGKTMAELEARRTLRRIYDFLRTINGCEALYVSAVTQECGIRETRRIVGEESISVKDYIGGKRFAKAVCYSYYPIDKHRSDTCGIIQIPLSPGVVPTIPYGALIPKGARRVLVAGRCISGDELASSAFRTQATCMAVGQAVGAAAALIVRTPYEGVLAVEYNHLRKVLSSQGAIVPD